MGKICKNCGKEAPLNANFCGHCGSKDFTNTQETNNTQELKPKSNKIYLFILLGIISFVAFFGLYYFGVSKSSEKITFDINDTQSNNDKNITNNTSENSSDTNETALNDQSIEDSCGGYTYSEILRAKYRCERECSAGCTDSEYKSCMQNNLLEQCNNRKPATEYNFQNAQNNDQNIDSTQTNSKEDMGTNKFKDAAYKLITGNKLSNSNDIVEKINSKNILIYCLADGSVCKTEAEVAKYLKVPTGGSIKKLFGHWVEYDGGKCNDDEDKSHIVIAKEGNLIRYEGYEMHGVVTRYAELDNGDIEIETSFDLVGSYSNRNIKLSMSGNVLYITWDPEGQKDKYKYCGDIK